MIFTLQLRTFPNPGLQKTGSQINITPSPTTGPQHPTAMTTPISSEPSLPTPGGTADTQRTASQKFRDIRHAVQTAAETRNRKHNHIESFSIPSQEDNTKADSDVRTFLQMARNYFRATYQHNCLIVSHLIASAQVSGLLHHIEARLAARKAERSLILLYYAGVTPLTRRNHERSLDRTTSSDKW